MAFRLVKPIDVSQISLYPKVERQDPTIDSKGWDKVGDYLLRDKIDFMPMKGLQEAVCSCESNLIFMCGAMSMGKAQPYDAKILTPCGYVPMGKLRVGDTIIGVDGKSQSVLRIFEQGMRDVCRVSFSDGTHTECDYEHLWNVRVSRVGLGKRDETITTRNLIDYLGQINPKHGKIRNIYIPNVAPVEYLKQDKPLPIHPYVLGVILGDGCTRASKPRVATPDIEVIARMKELGCDISKLYSDGLEWVFNDSNIRDNLKAMGLWNHLSYDKFIPKQYLFASIEDRLELLRGLMDTDGCPSGHSTAEYSTSSRRLADDVRFLVLSLGGDCRVVCRIPKYTYKGEIKEGHKSFRLYISFEDQSSIFNLSRKKSKCKNKRNPNYPIGRRVESVSHVGIKKCRCILVSNPDHLYVTDNFIVTHNTYCMDLIPLYGIDKPSYSGAMISVRALDSKKGSSIFRDALEVVGKFADCEVTSAETPTFFWRQWNSSFRLIHSNFNADNPTEWDEFKDYAKKVQASYIAIDEATQIKQFKMFIYWFGRNRDSSGMTPQMILSFNPEHTHFTTAMLRDAGYLDENWYLRPEMNGVTKYFYVAGDTPESIIWGDSYEAVAERANIHLTEKEISAGITIKQIIKTFTCFTGEAADNLKLVAATKGQALGNLHALGGTQRSINKGAYFGPIEKEDNNVSRSMIHNLWENPIDDDENMYATFDVGGGKGDSAPLIVWKGLQMISIDYFKGEPQELSNWIHSILNRYNVQITNFAYDGTGFGYWLQGLTNGLAITANKRPLKEYDEYGNEVMRDEYFNLRSQLLGKLEVALKRGDISCSIDKNKPVQFGVKNETRRFVDVLLDGIDLFATTIKNNKTYYKSKEEFKAKYKYSPGEIDSMMLRMVFELDTRERKQPKAQVSEDAYDEFLNPHPLNNWGNRYWRN